MARRVEISITMNNAAFNENEGGELARILRKLADCVENDLHVDEVHLRDVNGNTVGITIIFSHESKTFRLGCWGDIVERGPASRYE